jgi:mRNA-capping enzyme
MAINMFAESRPYGIYKQDYINELFKRYADPSDKVPIAPPQPEWDNDAPTLSIQNNEFDLSDDEFDGGNENESALTSSKPSASSSAQENSFKRNKKYDTPRPNKRPRNEDSKVNPKFCDESITQVEPEIDPDEVARVRRETQGILNWNGVTSFPGAQPVSMAYNNFEFLAMRKYMVSWKADGTRYLMYINGRDMVFMIDRDNSVFRVRNLFFPFRKDLEKHLMSTLVDGVNVQIILKISYFCFKFSKIN